MSVETLIVGSGVVATALAERILTEDPKASILILEAGDRVKTKDFSRWTDFMLSNVYPYTVQGDLPFPAKDTPGENLNVGTESMELSGARLFNYGGSTMHWGGWSFRLKPEDFHLATALGKDAADTLDWPFGYDTLEPYYCEAEGHLSVSGDSDDATVPRSKAFPFPAFPLTLEDEPIARAMKSLDIGFAKLPIARRGVTGEPSRHAPCQTTGTCKYCPFGARYVAANYLDDLRTWNDYPNLEVRLGAIVETIDMADRRRAASVTYVDRATQRTVTVEATRIVIAAGTIESAKLLQRSRSPAWPDGIGNDGDLVGRFLVTHPYLTFSGELETNLQLLQPEMDFPTLTSRHFDSPAEQAKGKWMMVNLPDTVPINLAALMKQGLTRDQIELKIKGKNIVKVATMIEVFGRKTNKVENMWTRNRQGLNQTIVSYSADPAFKNRTQEVKKEISTIFERMGASLTADPSISWRADHAGSTCRMSNDPEKGVVDSDLRVHGTDNVYVCSNAVLPNIGAINPTLTVTALALRLGKHLNGLGAGA